MSRPRNPYAAAWATMALVAGMILCGIVAGMCGASGHADAAVNWGIGAVACGLILLDWA